MLLRTPITLSLPFLFLGLACGGAPADGVAAPTPAMSAAAAPDAASPPASACAKAGGTCVNELATVACAGRAPAACGSGEFCCLR